jgi:hypothetical protein
MVRISMPGTTGYHEVIPRLPAFLALQGRRASLSAWLQDMRSQAIPTLARRILNRRGSILAGLAVC